jgi:hypothetical protein
MKKVHFVTSLVVVSALTAAGVKAAEIVTYKPDPITPVAVVATPTPTPTPTATPTPTVVPTVAPRAIATPVPTVAPRTVTTPTPKGSAVINQPGGR